MIRLFTLVWLFIALFSATQTVAEERLALVIGNGAYENVPSLPNPGNDARLMERTLSESGFRVTTILDANRAEMTAAIEQFGREVRAAGPGALALFYFAGHGVRNDGFNYLVPVSVSIRSEGDFKRETLAAEWVLDQIQAPGVTSVMVLDACRNNPFDDTGTLPELGDGLARMTANAGNLIAYATGPGDIALDGQGKNSPYTSALARALTIGDLDLLGIFTQVREEVVAATDGAQVPWETSSLNSAVYIQPATATDGPEAALSIEFNPEGWNTSATCRREFTYTPFALGLIRGRARRIESDGGQGVALELRMDDEKLTITPYPADDSSRAVTIKLDAIKAGGKRAFFTNLRHPDLFDCGAMTVHVRLK